MFWYAVLCMSYRMYAGHVSGTKISVVTTAQHSTMNKQLETAADSTCSSELGRDGAEQFAVRLRRQAEDAVAVSVHHASLCQQYLLIAQKFSALAEQAGGMNIRQLSQMADCLDREVATGIPSPPIGMVHPKSVPALYPPTLCELVPAAIPTQNGATQNATPRELGKAVSLLPEPEPEPEAEAHAHAPDGKSKLRRKKPKRVRDLAERLRLMAPQIMDRVRVKARKSDLKPVPRTATEELKKSRRSVLVSTTLFGLLLIVLGVIQLELEIEPPIPVIMAGFADEVKPVEDPLPVEPPAEDVGEQQEMETDSAVDEPEEESPPEEAPAESMPEEQSVQEPQVAEAAPSDVLQETAASAADSTSDSAAVDGRSAEGRAMMLQKYGGSAASESAVQRALQWLAARQRPDGSWDFVDVGTSGNAGRVHNPIGGTAYALLPFLAAGQSHRDKESTHRKTVEAGLNYLLKAGVRTPAGFDLRGVLNKGDKDKEPNEAYYVHGAAALALCEAWLMTKDRRLKPAAEDAIQFLVNSQDPQGGGWRYLPRQPGSTSVTATQLMALAAAKKSGFRIPDATFNKASFYLDSVQVDADGRYGYEVQKKSYQISVTAMALLSRMYLGWGRDDGNLRGGIQLLDKRGPYDNLYYTYFATQVMRNWGGDEWERWNKRMRDDLIHWQELDGPAAGSWTPRDRDHYSLAGGRLLTTCLATLTLEVYYRYQPILSDPPAGDNLVDAIVEAPADLRPIVSPQTSLQVDRSLTADPSVSRRVTTLAEAADVPAGAGIASDSQTEVTDSKAEAGAGRSGKQ